MKQSELHEFFDDNRREDGHGRRALRSGAVSIVARSVNALIQIGSVLCLARLLSPEDYGLVGMVAAITGFAQVLVDLGSRDAIAQRTRISQKEVSALFWITQSVGLLCAVAVASSGPLISRFYGEPRLTLIAVVSSLTFITSALTASHYALLRRAMRFQDLGIIEVCANLLGALLAVGLAVVGFQYWALVLRPIVATFFVAVGVWMTCRWFPPKPEVTPEVKSMVKFGVNITGFTMTDFVGKSADRVAIGYRAGAVTLGYYQNALFVYENLIDVVISPLHGVAVASLSKLQHDVVELRRSWAKALSTLTFYSMPAFGLLSVVSRDLIVLMLGAKWSNSGALLAIIALRGIPHSVERTNGWLHVVAGRTDRWMRWGAFNTVIHLAVLMFALRFGAIGVATAYVVTMFIMFAPAIEYAGRPLSIGARDVLKTVWPQMVGTIASVAVGFGLRLTVLSQMATLPRTALLTFVFAATYLAIVVGVIGRREPIQATLSLCRDVLPAPFLSRAKAIGLQARKGYERV